MDFTYDTSRSIVGHMLKSHVLTVFPEKSHENRHSRVFYYFIWTPYEMDCCPDFKKLNN